MGVTLIGAVVLAVGGAGELGEGDEPDRGDTGVDAGVAGGSGNLMPDTSWTQSNGLKLGSHASGEGARGVRKDAWAVGGGRVREGGH